MNLDVAEDVGVRPPLGGTMLTRLLGRCGVAILVFGLLGTAPVAEANLIRSVWECHLPCVSKTERKLLGYIEVSYCATSVLSPEMLETMNPVCQAKTKQADAIAAKSEPASVAKCSSSGNPCPKEGLTRSAFTCVFLCPSEGPSLRKFTACGTTGDEAWTHAVELCKDATPPHSDYFPSAQVCTAEGQTPCE